jgi:hypothetical protein
MKAIDSIKKKLEDIDEKLSLQLERGANDIRRRIIKKDIEDIEHLLDQLKLVNFD